jgi:hypothetical protein
MKQKRKAPIDPKNVELPDAWERFEKAFDTVMRAKPKPAKKKPAPSVKRGGSKPT